MRGSEAAVDVDPTMVEFERIVKVCDSFEAQWRRGERPRIEEFLGRNPSLPRPVLFRELLALELELAQAAGSAPTADEYRARFPDLIQGLEDVFADNGPDTAGPRTDRPAATDDHTSGGSTNSPASSHPSKIGRYTVLSLLDEGGARPGLPRRPPGPEKRPRFEARGAAGRR